MINLRKQLLDDIEYLLDKERATWYESKSMENTHDSVTNNIIHLDPKRRKNMKKFIITTCNYGYYKDENGKPYKSSGGKMIWNEKIKRDIPKGWEVENLKNGLIFSL